MLQIMRFIIPALILFLFLVYPLSAVPDDFLTPDLGFDHSYVSDTIPDRLEPGHTYPVMVTFKNVGLVTWESRTHRVGLLYNGNPSQIVAIPVFVEIPSRATVSRGQNVTFALSLLPVGLPGPSMVSFSVVYRTAQGDRQVTETWEKPVTIVPTDGISSPVNGSIVVESIYDGLSISLAGIPMGTVPCIIPDLRPGTYELEIRGSSLYRKIPVLVEKGTMTRVFIDNNTGGPRIDLKKVSIASDGTVFAYIEANVPLIGMILLFIIGCIGLMIHAVRMRRDTEENDVGKEKVKKGKDNQDSYDPVRQEKELLKEYHQKPPLFEAVSPVGDPGSGSGCKDIPILSPPAAMKNVREFSRDMLDKKPYGGGSKNRGMVFSPDSGGEMAGLEISLQGFEVHARSGKANVAAWNRTSDSLTVEGYQVSPGCIAEIPVDVPEPSSEEYTVTISLRIVKQAGQSFLHALQIPYNRGIALLARGVYEKAYEFFLDASKKNPQHIDALLNKARILIRWGLYEEAEAVIGQVLAIDPDHLEARQISKEVRARRKKKEQEKGKGSERIKIPGFPDFLYDRYTPIRLLGKDELASIFLVIRNDNEEIRALKIAREDIAANSGLYTEISTLYQLRHPNVLKMFKAEFSPRLFLELEYASGVQIGDTYCRTLADLKPPLSDTMASPLIEAIASGLAYIHMKGVRHYHLSPKYILLDEPMTPKISGLMRSSLTPIGSFSQDPLAVLAPEQRNSEKYGKKGMRTDLFQLGTVWYWLMTGTLPYGGEPISADGIVGVYLPLGIVNPDLRMYDPLMKGLLALDKRDRYGSAEEFLADLRGIRMYETLPSWMRQE